MHAPLVSSTPQQGHPLLEFVLIPKGTKQLEHGGLGPG